LLANIIPLATTIAQPEAMKIPGSPIAQSMLIETPDKEVAELSNYWGRSERVFICN
jgi:hypothetical protein